MLIKKIERFGDNIRSSFSFETKKYNSISKGLGDSLIGGIESTSWIAEIKGLCPKYKFQREFVNGQWDYSEANSKGSRGVFVYYQLEEGKIYEVKSQISWNRVDRYFCRIDNGKEIKLERSEVEECLKNI